MVEVFKKELISIQVDQINPILAGYTSHPIKVHLNKAPEYSITIQIALAIESTEITIEPTTLDFSPGINDKYF